MASSFPISCTTTNNSFLTKSSHSSPHHYPFPKPPKMTKMPLKGHNKVPCNASSSNDETAPQTLATPDIPQAKLDRRNVLLGLGGLYAAYQLANPSNPSVVASPVPAPDITKCRPATITFSTDKVPYSCCPPFSGTVTDYKLPSFSELNVRPAAHAVDEEYLEKYELAYRKMKELPADDPRNFYQQANVHCAYCSGAYQLANGLDYQVHFNWLFFPFHRWYLYFHERILQSLIDDPTFTMPYWNWDNPQGMYLPDIFDNASSPLYDAIRNLDHRGGDAIMDLAYDSGDVHAAKDLQILRNNLAIMYRQMVTNAPCPSLFFGNALRGEGYDTNSGMGTIERVPHNPLHQWVGDPNMDHQENMGNFYSAAKDPIFYCHHWNVDRLWSIWKTIGGKRKDISDPDWLQTEFLFYDENKNLVKIKIEDCLDNENLGYTFQDMPTPWRNFRPTRKRKTKLRSIKSIPPANDVLPATLDKIVTFYVTRPAVSRTEKDKEDKEELLNLDINYDDTKYIRFDVFLNEDNDVNALELDRAEYQSSFSNLAHVHEGSDDQTPRTTTWSLPITELLEDLGLEPEIKIAVTLVPKWGGSAVTVDSANVTLVSC